MRQTVCRVVLGSALAAGIALSPLAEAQGPRVQPPKLVGPQRASDLVTLVNSSQTAVMCVDIAGVALDERQKPDGTRESFTIPAGRVLVLTRVEIAAQFESAAAGSVVPVQLALQAPGPPASYSYVSLGTLTPGNAPAFGSALGSAAADIHGVSVRPGATLCAAAFPPATTLRVVVHGFLAADE